jgi:hypothetical protein
MYNASLDTTLWSNENAELGLEVKVVQYNSGEPKVQITRFEANGSTKVYQKLGRMTMQEASWIADVLKSALVKVATPA